MREIKAGTVLLEEGQKFLERYLIMKGTVKASNAGGDLILRAGDIMGLCEADKDEAVFTYKVDNVYAPQAEASVLFSDEQIGIEWPIDAKEMILSPKDLAAVSFGEAEYFD